MPKMCESKICPLLASSHNYSPDTLNLSEDSDARLYWFKCFENLVEKFAVRAKLSQQNDCTSISRAEAFKKEYIVRLNELKNSKWYLKYYFQYIK